MLPRDGYAVFLCCDIQQRTIATIHEYQRVVRESGKLLDARKYLRSMRSVRSEEYEEDQVSMAPPPPLLVTEQYPKGLGNTVPCIADKVQLSGDDADLDENGFVVLTPKTTFSMVNEHTEVQFFSQLPNEPLDMILFGTETHVCILQTAAALLEIGHNVFIAAEAVSSMTKDQSEGGVSVMKTWGASNRSISVIPTDSIIFALLGSSRHTNFKAVSAIIKECNNGGSAPKC